MKKYILIPFVSALFAGFLFAQVPQFINYQGMARNASGQPLANKGINVRLSIITGSIAGTTDYSELQPVTTNGLGLFNVAIGAGNPVIGNYATVNWALGPKFIRSEIDPNGGNSFVLVATSQFLAVPYALYALSSAPPKQPTVNVTASASISDQYCRPSSTTSINANLTLVADQVVSTSAFAVTSSNLGIGSVFFSNIVTGIYNIGLTGGSYYNAYNNISGNFNLNPNYSLLAGGKSNVDIGNIIRIAPFDLTSGIANFTVTQAQVSNPLVFTAQYSNLPSGTTTLRLGYNIFISKNPDMSSSILFPTSLYGSVLLSSPTQTTQIALNQFQQIFTQLGVFSGNLVYFQAEVLSTPCIFNPVVQGIGNGNKSNIASYTLP